MKITLEVIKTKYDITEDNEKSEDDLDTFIAEVELFIKKGELHFRYVGDDLSLFKVDCTDFQRAIDAFRILSY